MRLTAHPYTLTFKRPAVTSRGALFTKQVVFLAATHADLPDVVGWGECSPMPGLSIDDLPDYVDRVQSVCDTFNAGSDMPALGLTELPSVASGLETALRDLQTGGQQRLFDTAFSRGQAALPTHGLIWMDTREGVLDQVEQKAAQGCRVIKMKVGALPFEREHALLKSIRQRFPRDEMELRLDANGVFAPDEALEHLERLAEFDVAFLEQPIAAGRWQEMADLCARSPIPVALDEELIGIAGAEARRQLLDTIRPQHLILKPSLLGGLAACEAWIDEAERLGSQWWINSLLESNIGLNAICQWTSARQSKEVERVHGLGTGQLYANNIPSPLRLEACGLRLDPAASWDYRSILT